jgi:hypothetical protein
MRRVSLNRDLSEPAIIEVFKASGWSVLRISVKDGPDFFAAKHGAETLTAIGPVLYPTRARFSYMRTVAVECKTGKRKLRPGQSDFQSVWQGEYVVLRSADEALDFVRDTGAKTCRNPL